MDTYNLGAVQSTTDGPGFNIVGVHGRPLVTFSFDTQEEADAGWRRDAEGAPHRSSKRQAPSLSSPSWTAWPVTSHSFPT